MRRGLGREAEEIFPSEDRGFVSMVQAVRAVYEQGWLRLLDP